MENVLSIFIAWRNQFRIIIQKMFNGSIKFMRVSLTLQWWRVVISLQYNGMWTTELIDMSASNIYDHEEAKCIVYVVDNSRNQQWPASSWVYLSVALSKKRVHACIYEFVLLYSVYWTVYLSELFRKIKSLKTWVSKSRFSTHRLTVTFLYFV